MTQQSDARPAADDVPEHVSVLARLGELLESGSEREVALVTRLVRGFPAKASGLVDRWWTATLHGDHEEAVRAVHTLRGTVLNLGSNTVSRVCEDIESRSRTGHRDGETADRERLVSAVATFAQLLVEAASAYAITG